MQPDPERTVLLGRRDAQASLSERRSSALFKSASKGASSSTALRLVAGASQEGPFPLARCIHYTHSRTLDLHACCTVFERGNRTTRACSGVLPNANSQSMPVAHSGFIERLHEGVQSLLQTNPSTRRRDASPVLNFASIIRGNSLSDEGDIKVAIEPSGSSPYFARWKALPLCCVIPDFHFCSEVSSTPRIGHP
ncbi:hypothetical protein BKA93DRAFT_799862 [Sparassis latifolia]